MRSILTLSAFLLACASAQAGSDTIREINTDVCVDPQFSRSGWTALCKAPNAAVVLRAKLGDTYKRVPAAFAKKAVSAVELGLLPDDSTDLRFSYTKPLLDRASDKTVGFAQFTGYTNSEMEASLKILVKYNLKGQVVSVTIIEEK